VTSSRCRLPCPRVDPPSAIGCGLVLNPEHHSDRLRSRRRPCTVDPHVIRRDDGLTQGTSGIGPTRMLRTAGFP
jgi:hypothetical protein